MRVTLPIERLKTALNADPEFRIAARYWDGALQLEIGDEPYLIALTAGEVTAISHERGRDGEPRRVVITAPVEDWAKLLQDPPPPFYHDFYPAVTWHNFRFGGDSDYLWSYYAAIRRAGEVLRATANVARD